jgi:hypothetical protein
MAFVKVGRWVLQTEDVTALEHRVDGAAVKLKGGHEIRLSKVEARAFLTRFGQDATIEDLGVVHEPLSGESEA